MKKNLFIIAAALVLASCGGNHQKADDPLADSGRTQRTENLLHNLIALGDSSVYLFGHHDATVYGIGWQADYTSDSTVHQRSDVHSVCNDHPALLSFDLGHIELGDSLNLDGVPFQRIRQEVIAHYDRGGMVTLSWHLDNPLSGGTAWVADSLKAEETHTVFAGDTLWRPRTRPLPTLARAYRLLVLVGTGPLQRRTVQSPLAAHCRPSP